MKIRNSLGNFSKLLLAIPLMLGMIGTLPKQANADGIRYFCGQEGGQYFVKVTIGGKSYRFLNTSKEYRDYNAQRRCQTISQKLNSNAGTAYIVPGVSGSDAGGGAGLKVFCSSPVRRSTPSVCSASSILFQIPQDRSHNEMAMAIIDFRKSPTEHAPIPVANGLFQVGSYLNIDVEEQVYAATQSDSGDTIYPSPETGFYNETVTQQDECQRDALGYCL